MSVARAIQWQRMRVEAEALLSRIDADAAVARQQRAKIARARAERVLKAARRLDPRKLPDNYTGNDASAAQVWAYRVD
jgi:hypothetical protein